MHHLSHLCRPGRPIITPACKYWSTAPVCMCYFKMPRPVISMLMIVIAKATGSAWLFKACGYQWEAGRPSTQIQTCTREVGSGAGWCSNEGALGRGWVKSSGRITSCCLSVTLRARQRLRYFPGTAVCMCARWLRKGDVICALESS